MKQELDKTQVQCITLLVTYMYLNGKFVRRVK